MVKLSRGKFFIVIYVDGDKYQGELRNAQAHGQGTYTFADGRKQIGEWKDDDMWNAKQYGKNGNIEGKTVNGVWRSQ